MIELIRDELIFTFPEVHPHAKLCLDFQRTLRIPDDGRDYPLPPGLGHFPLRHVDDFAANVPPAWRERGGVMFPMFQSEAMWIRLRCAEDPARLVGYPFAIKVATGKINAVTGQEWTNGLHRRPQDYMVAPPQPWLDGYCVEQGVIRQFVAMPLGAGYSVEEQITGAAEFGGVQVIAYPMKREVFERRFPVYDVEQELLSARFGSATEPRWEGEGRRLLCPSAMGLAPGGRMKQQIYDDPYDFDDWDLAHSSRCFVHLTNSLAWRAITGEAPPTMPPTAKQYAKARLPWFDYYDDASTAVGGSGILDKLKSVVGMGNAKGETPLPENESCTPQVTVPLKPKRSPNEVREGTF
jgi:hypothetical protein